MDVLTSTNNEFLYCYDRVQGEGAEKPELHWVARERVCVCSIP